MKIPFGLTRVVVALCGVGTTIGASLLVSNISGPATVRIPQWAGPNYAQDVSGFHPVTKKLIVDVATSRSPSAPSVTTRDSTIQTPGAGGTLPVPASSPGSLPKPVPIPGPAAPPRPVLNVSIAADRDRSHPNDTIAYVIRVTNSGLGAATGLVVESHVPDGTTLTEWVCNGVVVLARGEDQLSCGATANASHPIAFGVSLLAPGATLVEEFWVRVGHDVTHNTDLVNHAHVYAQNADLIDSEEAAVIIR